MIAYRRYLCQTSVLLFLTIAAFSQGETANEVDTFKPPLKRALFHDAIDREQKVALRADGVSDNLLALSNNDEINFIVTHALVKKVDHLQYSIEKDSLIGEQQKVGYLRSFERLLKNINSNLQAKRMNVSNVPRMVEGFERALLADRSGESIEPIIMGYSYEVGNAIVRSEGFEKNPGIALVREGLIRKYCALYPSRIFATLRENPNVSFRDSLIKVAAYKNPRQLYDYAAANNRLGFAIAQIDDPLVKTITRISRSGGSGQLYFPFLDNLISGKMKFEDVELRDSIKYFGQLVQTRLDYVERAMNKDTAIAFEQLDRMLSKKVEQVFVNTINGLHNSDDAVRFRILQQLTASELYYVAVLSDGVIYTSSYTRGVYPLMMSKIGNRGDSLLQLVKFDRFKKFIKVAAAFNTLNDFLNSFHKKEDAKMLMTAFVNGLERSGSLEDGVDVADSYTSISEGNKELADYILNLTKWNYDRVRGMNDKRGMVMYNLLYNLFKSADSTNNIDLSKELGIPPVYEVKNKDLVNDTGQIVMQMFFFGDKDGKNDFNAFMRQFDNNWKITQTEQWVTIQSVKGKPVTLYANKPLPEETNKDAEAQQALNEYIAKQGQSPTVVFHRGHSYYAPYTIEQILPSARIVFMGSCGGFNLIHNILEHAPDAHIIASKQIGKTAINQPFINLILEKARTGQDIQWISFWKEFNRNVKVEGLEDYIPPHKNLGSIFIKAYKVAMGPEESVEL